MDVDLSIIVPAYDEEESVRPLNAAIVRAVEPLGRSFELIYVEDGSTDGTFRELLKLAQEDHRIVVVKFRKNFGQTAAMAAGIDRARGDLLVTLDADLQNDPGDIPTLITKLEEGYGMVVGYRLRRQDSLVTRKIPSVVANWLIGKAVGLPIRDNGCSLKVFRASVIRRIPLYSDMHRFIPAVSIPVGTSIAQVGVRHHARQFGNSKYGLSRVYKVAIDLVAIRTMILFAARPLACFSSASAVAGTFATFAALLAAQSGSRAAEPLVVLSTVSLLFGWLALFLFSCGIIISLAHLRNRGGTGLNRRAFAASCRPEA